jgi:hypothetical protein
MNHTTDQPLDTPTVEVTPEASNGAAVALRHPGVPVSMEQLAALRGEAQEIVQARAVVMTTLRIHGIRLTSPEDWLLFKAPDNSIIGYLQDCGCDRVRDLFGIEVFEVGKPEKVVGNAPGEFHYIVTGSGRCRVTGQAVEGIEGGRSSGDDFCKHKAGVALDLAVRKAARANLDGNITRELSGMQSVPIRDLEGAWQGSNKKTAQCRLGRGFGGKSERLGGHTTTREQPTDLEAPVCEECQKTMRFVPAGENKESGKKWGAFWSCPDFKKIDGKGNGHSTMNDAAYRESLAKEANHDAA